MLLIAQFQGKETGHSLNVNVSELFSVFLILEIRNIQHYWGNIYHAIDFVTKLDIQACIIFKRIIYALKGNFGRT